MVPRLHSADFEKSYLAHEPAILIDGLRNWKAIGLWTPAYLSAIAGDKDTEVAISVNGRFDYRVTHKSSDESPIAYSLHTMKLKDAAEVITAASGDRNVYVMQRPLPVDFPELMPDIELPSWVRNDPNAIINLWFGCKSLTPLHFDGANNFFAQVYGRKHFTIFAPNDMPYLYPFPADAKTSHISAVDPDNVDPTTHPLFTKASPLRFTLEPGDLLFLPAYWWHQVQSEDVAISVSMWSDPSLQQATRTSPRLMNTLVRMYQYDRLAMMKPQILAKNGLDFLSGAEFFMNESREDAAALLVFAALDEIVRASRHSAEPAAQGCVASAVTDELEASSALLAEQAIFLPDDLSLAQKIIAAGRKVFSRDANLPASDQVMTRAELAPLLSGLRALEQRLCLFGRALPEPKNARELP